MRWGDYLHKAQVEESVLCLFLSFGLFMLLCVFPRPCTIYIYFIHLWHDTACLCWKCCKTPTKQTNKLHISSHQTGCPKGLPKRNLWVLLWDIFTGWMHFLSPNPQCETTEGTELCFWCWKIWNVEMNKTKQQIWPLFNVAIAFAHCSFSPGTAVSVAKYVARWFTCISS